MTDDTTRHVHWYRSNTGCWHAYFPLQGCGEPELYGLCGACADSRLVECGVAEPPSPTCTKCSRLAAKRLYYYQVDEG